MPKGIRDLPSAHVGGVTRAFSRFLRIEAAAGGLLIAATVLALASPTPPGARPISRSGRRRSASRSGGLDYARTLRSWINDGLMTLFFFVIALELKRELVLGELRDLRTAALSLAGALGGIAAPAALFLAAMWGQPGAHGWGVPIATDTAFVMGCLSLFGGRAPASLRLFLLSLAIFDDVGAILVVAVAYGHALDWGWLAVACAGLCAVYAAARIGLRSAAVYVGLGLGVWLALDRSGVHPTVAGVALGLMTPATAWVGDARLRAILGRVLANPPGGRWSGDTSARRDLQSATSAAHEALSPVERLEIMLHPWVGFAIMPVFALANAGVILSPDAFSQPVALAIAGALAVGKPAGVVGFAWLATRAGVARPPPGLSWGVLAAGAMLSGIGFTMSLFVADLAFAPPLSAAAKIGVFGGSVVAATAGMLSLLIATRGRDARRDLRAAHAKPRASSTEGRGD
jgi:NhaA family Na+:H+ antiporter